MTSNTNLGKNKYQVFKLAKISYLLLPPLVSFRPSKNDLEKSEYYQNRNTKPTENKNNNNNK